MDSADKVAIAGIAAFVSIIISIVIAIAYYNVHSDDLANQLQMEYLKQGWVQRQITVSDAEHPAGWKTTAWVKP